MSNKKSKRVEPIRGHQGKAYPLYLRRAAARDYLSGMTRAAVAEKYSLPNACVISDWKRKFASLEIINASAQMIKRRKKRVLQTDAESCQSARIKELEHTLEECRKSLLEKETTSGR